MEKCDINILETLDLEQLRKITIGAFIKALIDFQRVAGNDVQEYSECYLSDLLNPEELKEYVREEIATVDKAIVSLPQFRDILTEMKDENVDELLSRLNWESWEEMVSKYKSLREELVEMYLKD
ncbi:MAG: hypothetical protein ACOC1K_02245 [Nanoarchaeota archaeon]